MSKFLTVFGATGNQGGSVIRRVLGSPELSKIYKIRAVTRDVSKPAAKELESKGIEVVSGNLDDRESVFAAVKGSSAVFGITNFWERFSKDAEISQGKNIADASKEAGVEHLIWSSLVNVSKVTNGKNTGVKHFDSKAEVEEYIRSQNIPATFFLPGVFGAGLLSGIQKGEGDTYSFAYPFADTVKIPIIDASGDSGLFVAAALLEGPTNKRLAAATAYYTPKEISEAFFAATGKPLVFNSLSYETFRGFLPPSMASEIIANMQLIENPGYYAGEPADALDQTLALVEKHGLPKPITLKDFFAKNFQ